MQNILKLQKCWKRNSFWTEMGSDSRNEPPTEDIRATSFASCTEDDLFKHLVEMETTEFTVFRDENVYNISDSVHNPNKFYGQMVSDTRCSKGSYFQSLEGSFSRKKRKTDANGESELSGSKDAGNSRKKNENQNMEKLKEQIDHKPAAPNGLMNPKAKRHNLAERSRRERIDERMKFLQGLVPGCDKIMGKAVMLDEIINYILSMQHQVEILYRKLAALNLSEKSQPDQFLSKDICLAQGVIEATEGDHN